VATDRDGLVPTIIVDARSAPVPRHAPGATSAPDQVPGRPTWVQVTMPLHLTIVSASNVARRQQLQTTTHSLCSDGVRFQTTARLEVGDVLEARMIVEVGDPIGARLTITRVDQPSGSYKHRVQARFDEILRSDLARLTAIVPRRAAGTSGG